MIKPADDLETFILKRLHKLNMSKAELMRQAGLSRTVYYSLNVCQELYNSVPGLFW